MSSAIGGAGGPRDIPDDAAGEAFNPAAAAAEAADAMAQAAVARGPGKAARPMVAGAAPAAGGARTPEQTAAAFYDALANGRFDEMESLYAPDVKFRDEVFEYADRKGTMGMWRTLFGKTDVRVTSRITGIEGDKVRVHWDAHYKFGTRPVHNEIDSVLTIRDGKIVDQRDSFSWEKWARQALPLGKLGETEAVHKVVSHLLRWAVSVAT
jgi:ketosteroid isomerase-like protein